MGNLSNRIPSLDGLRTISIALVIVSHLLRVFGTGEGNFGNLGVRVFFVISGFLITGLLASEIGRTSTVNLLKFYFRRTLRIFPPYYFYLFVILIATLVGLGATLLASFVPAALYLTDYVSPGSFLLGHSWSLSVEEQFYLILPGVLLLLGIRRTKVFLIFVVLLAPIIRIADLHISGAEQLWLTKGFHSNMDALAFGCLLALFRERVHQVNIYRRLVASPFTIVVLTALIIILNDLPDHPHIFLGASITLINLMIAFCLDWSVTNYRSMFGRFLNSGPMVRLGMMSYSIYLWQQPFFNPYFDSILTRAPYNFIGLTIGALFSYYVVEKYSLNLRQKWEAILFGKKAEPELHLGETVA